MESSEAVYITFQGLTEMEWKLYLSLELEDALKQELSDLIVKYQRLQPV